MRWLLTSALFGFLCAQNARDEVQPWERVDLTLRVVDRYGRERPYSVSSLQPTIVGPSKVPEEFGARFQGMTIRGIRRRPYRVILEPRSNAISGISLEGGECRDARVVEEVSPSGSGSTLMVLTAAQQCKRIMVDLSDNSRTKWRLNNRPSGRIWLRIQSVFGPPSVPIDAEVASDGTFSANPSVGHGLYVATLFREDKVLGHAAVAVDRAHITGSTVVEINWK